VNRSSSTPDPDQPDAGKPGEPAAAKNASDSLQSDRTRGIDEPTLGIPLNRDSGGREPSPDSIETPSPELAQGTGSQGTGSQGTGSQGTGKRHASGPDATMSDSTTLDATIAQGEMQQGRISNDLTGSEAPANLGRYQIEALLGRGGMGSVYRAHDTQLDRKVALKVPKFESNTKSRLVDRFYREARSAANLAHPNLCPVFDVGEVDGTHYIAMALIKGDTLSSHIRNNAELPERFAAITVLKIARAMQEAHGSGIIHRDLKPANIMIDHRKEPIVMDFGLACPDEIDDDSRLTQEGALLGSPAYMSPEQLRGAEDSIGQGSDVYALGVVLYEILSGRLPFAGNGSTISMIGQILTEEPTDLKSLRPTISNGLAQICAKAMAKDSTVRYGSMKLLANDLERFIRSAAARKKSSNSGTKTVQANVTQIQLNEQSKLVKTLCESKQFTAALPILQQILDNPQAKNSKTQQWAAATLSNVQTRIKEDKQKQLSANSTQPTPTATIMDGDLFADLPVANATSGQNLHASTRPTRKSTRKSPGGFSRNLIFVAAGIALVALIGGGYWFWPQESSSTPVPVIPETPNEIADDKQKPQPQPSPNNFDRRMLIDRVLQQFDKNKDGFIEAQEMTRPTKSILMRFDSNEDGRLSRQEIQTINPRILAPLQSDRPGGNNFNRGQRQQGGPNGFENGRPGFGGPGFNGSQPRGDAGPNQPFRGNDRPGANPRTNPPNGDGERAAGGLPFERQGAAN